jgi:hypothetical protein
MTRVRSCDHCGEPIAPKEKYVKCVEVGDITDKYNHSRRMNGVGDLCMKCAKEVLKI